LNENSFIVIVSVPGILGTDPDDIIIYFAPLDAFQNNATIFLALLSVTQINFCIILSDDSGF